MISYTLDFLKLHVLPDNSLVNVFFWINLSAISLSPYTIHLYIAYKIKPHSTFGRSSTDLMLKRLPKSQKEKQLENHSLMTNYQ